MKFSEYNQSNIEDINKLFIKTFTDSEGESEGLVIGELVNEYMTSTNANDFYCFVATEDEQIVGGVFFTKLTFKNGVNSFIL
ncbi:MAG: GNAT family N-acetyltransferase, partial [Bacteroidota bacterium]